MFSRRGWVCQNVRTLCLKDWDTSTTVFEIRCIRYADDEAEALVS